MPKRPMLAVCAFVFALPVSAQPQAVIRVPQDAPSVGEALIGAAGDTRIELAAGRYSEVVVVEGVSLTLAPQAGAEGRVSWYADLDEDGVAIEIIGAPTVRPVVTIEGIEFFRAGIDAQLASLEVRSCSFTGGGVDAARPLRLIDCETSVVQSAFTSADMPSSGGAIFASGGELYIADSTFDDCSTDGSGGAVFTRYSNTATIESCVFDRCFAGQGGGAVHGQMLTLVDCVFERNETWSSGGAVELIGQFWENSVDSCSFSFNRAVFDDIRSGGGAVSGAGIIERSTFDDNRGGVGGAVLMTGGRIVDSTFRRNQATRFGSIGGAACLDPGDIEGCMFIRNRADEGGAVFSPFSGLGPSTVTRSVFAANSARIGGGVSTVRTVNQCVFLDNFAAAGAAVWPGRRENEVSHSVMIGNIGPAVSWVFNPQGVTEDDVTFPAACVFGAGQTVSVNGLAPQSRLVACIGDPAIIGPGAIDLDPMFTRMPSDGGDGWGDDPFTPGVDESLNDDFGDLTPLPGSPLIDAAPLLTGMPALDMAGNPRVHDDPGIPTARPDIGPYEFQGASCLPDVNGDGSATPSDFGAWLDAFNARSPLADQNRDGRVSPNDLHGWVLRYGEGCP
ncbi:MAG: right-handed parallel beta-helix repeat-containing protein [Planctomycetota bacterium]